MSPEVTAVRAFIIPAPHDAREGKSANCSSTGVKLRQGVQVRPQPDGRSGQPTRPPDKTKDAGGLWHTGKGSWRSGVVMGLPRPSAEDSLWSPGTGVRRLKAGRPRIQFDPTHSATVDIMTPAGTLRPAKCRVISISTL